MQGGYAGSKGAASDGRRATARSWPRRGPGLSGVQLLQDSEASDDEEKKEPSDDAETRGDAGRGEIEGEESQQDTTGDVWRELEESQSESNALHENSRGNRVEIAVEAQPSGTQAVVIHYDLLREHSASATNK
ncbi:hypothetical protein V7S43_000287 [Phytophthora oleae]|uniref:Uncharacterized protein n=1 Tax=Phytophthora oleae TaxID=2107226 RepID=A0ABD3G6M8_9STRA